MNIEIKKGIASGQIIAPPSKSYAHRLLISAALANGKSKISGIINSVDMQATLDCISALGVEYARDSEEYQELLDRAFDALAQNTGFQKALLATNNSTLTHSIGKSKEQETVLTKQEFCSRLTKIRSKLQGE